MLDATTTSTDGRVVAAREVAHEAVVGERVGLRADALLVGVRLRQRHEREIDGASIGERAHAQAEGLLRVDVGEVQNFVKSDRPTVLASAQLSLLRGDRGGAQEKSRDELVRLHLDVEEPVLRDRQLDDAGLRADQRFDHVAVAGRLLCEDDCVLRRDVEGRNRLRRDVVEQLVLHHGVGDRVERTQRRHRLAVGSSARAAVADGEDRAGTGLLLCANIEEMSGVAALLIRPCGANPTGRQRKRERAIVGLKLDRSFGKRWQNRQQRRFRECAGEHAAEERLARERRRSCDAAALHPRASRRAPRRRPASRSLGVP